MYNNDMTISIGQLTVRKLALQLLDEPTGIKKEAYETLSIMLTETDNEDILENVDLTQDGRAYVGEDYAEEELVKVEREIKIQTST